MTSLTGIRNYFTNLFIHRITEEERNKLIDQFEEVEEGEGYHTPDPHLEGII